VAENQWESMTQKIKNINELSRKTVIKK